MLIWERFLFMDLVEVFIFLFLFVMVCCVFILLFFCKNCGKSGLFLEEDLVEKGFDWFLLLFVLGLKGEDMLFLVVFLDNDCLLLFLMLKGEFIFELVLNVDLVLLFLLLLFFGLNGDVMLELVFVFVFGLNWYGCY